MWAACLAPAQRTPPPRPEPLTARLALLPQRARTQALPGFSKLPRNLTRLLLARSQQNLQSPLIRNPDPSPFSHSIAALPAEPAAPCWSTEPFVLLRLNRPPALLCLCRNVPSFPPGPPRNNRSLHSSSAPAALAPPRNPILWSPASPSLRVSTPLALRTFEFIAAGLQSAIRERRSWMQGFFS